MKILFITSNRVGDAVLSTGLLAWLVDKYTDAEFTIACGPYAVGLFRAVPRLERLIILEKKSWNRHWLELWQACFGTHWGMIVDLRNSIVSYLLRTEWNVRPVKLDDRHKVLENAAALGLDPPPAPHIWLNAPAQHEAARLLPATRPLLALAPGANWPCKQWPIERFAALAQKLIAADGPLAGATVVVIGDGHERTQLAPLLQSLPAERRVEIIGQDLLTVAACIKQCQLFVGNDSGLMHVAAAMGTPTLGLFGPGYEEIYGPWGMHCAYVRTPESREVLLARLPDLSVREPNLMGGLSVDAAYKSAADLVRRK